MVEEEEEEEMEESIDEFVGGADEEVDLHQHQLQTGAQSKHTFATPLHTHSGPGRRRKVVL